MPEIVFPKPRDTEIPGFACHNDNVKLAGAVTVCDLMKYDANGGVKNPTNNPRPNCVALHTGVIGQWISVGNQGELAGFDRTGINPGDFVYPSGTVAGGMATGAQAQSGAPPVGHISPDGERIVFTLV